MPAPAPAVAEPALPPDDIIASYEENKHRWSWLALRTARDQYLQHFGKIGAGDVVALAQEIEKEKKEREERERAAASEGASATPNANLVAGTTGAGDDGGTSPAGAAAGTVGEKKDSPKEEGTESSKAPPKDPEGDVKMEER